MLSQRPINYLRICSYFTIFSLILSMQNNKSLLFSRTKNVPWHILAPSAVVYDFLPLRASAHPAGGFLSYRKAISYTIKKASPSPRQNLLSFKTSIFHSTLQETHSVTVPNRLLWFRCLRAIQCILESIGHISLTFITESSGANHLTAGLTLNSLK